MEPLAHFQPATSEILAERRAERGRAAKPDASLAPTKNSGADAAAVQPAVARTLLQGNDRCRGPSTSLLRVHRALRSTVWT